MEIQLQIKMNRSLYLRDPESSALGKKIVRTGVEFIYENGFEVFTFKKLASSIGTTEAGIYRYFENKHRLLIYLTAWYWSWLEFQILFQTNNMANPQQKLRKVIKILATPVKHQPDPDRLNEFMLHQIVIAEGSKAYLTRHVMDDNHQQLFKPYKDLCAVIGEMILACNPHYKYPKSLGSTIIEMAHFQQFFMHNLPALTDFGKTRRTTDVIDFLNDLVFSAMHLK